MNPMFSISQAKRNLLISLQIVSFISVSYTQNLVNGPIIGAVTKSSARILLQFDQPGVYSINIYSSKSNQIIDVTTTALISRNNMAIFNIENLEPKTKYYIVLPENKKMIVGSFTTFGEKVNYINFTFGSCMENTRTDSIFVEMKKHKPDFFLHLGDWTYPGNRNFPDTHVTGRDYYYSEEYLNVIEAYEVRYHMPNMSGFLSNTPIDFMHDDDDFIFDGNSRYTNSYHKFKKGKNYIGEDSLPPESRDNSLRGYDELFPHYPLQNLSQGVYHSFTNGQIEVFFVDSRANRDSETACFKFIDGKLEFSPDTSHHMLGITQMNWLKDGLKRSTAHWKFIVSGTNFNLGYKQVMDMALSMQNIEFRKGSTGGTIAARMAAMWIGYPYDQAELINFCHSEKIKNIIILSGDAHTSAIDDGTNSGFPELMSANLGVKNEKIASIVYNKMGLDIWNKGGQGINNENYNYCFGKVEVFGTDSVKLSIVDTYGTVVAQHTQIDGHLVKPVELKSLIEPNVNNTIRLTKNLLKLMVRLIE